MKNKFKNILKKIYLIMEKKAYETCIEMMHQRGYVISDQDDDRILANRVNQFTGEEEYICIFLSKAPKFNVSVISEFISMLKKMEINHCIIVYKDTITPVAKKTIADTKEFKIELFREEELQYNLTKHVLVPKHILAYKKGTADCIEFKKKYGDKIPVILHTDAVARFFGFETGDIIKIIRKNGIITYRIMR